MINRTNEKAPASGNVSGLNQNLIESEVIISNESK